MPRAVTEYRCLVISPGDVPEERDAVVDVIHRWNASVGANRGIRVDWVCVVWDADFRFTPRGWEPWSFRGNGWQRIRSADR